MRLTKKALPAAIALLIAVPTAGLAMDIDRQSLRGASSSDAFPALKRDSATRESRQAAQAAPKAQAGQAGQAARIGQADLLSLRAADKGAGAPAIPPKFRAKDLQTYSGTTVGSPLFTDWFNNYGGSEGYAAVGVSVSANDNCEVLLESVGGVHDTWLFVYDGPFDPGSVLTNLYANNDDYSGVNSGFAALPLAAGTDYVFVAAGWGPGDNGPFDLTVDCPVANVTMAAPAPNGIFLDNPASNSPVLVANELIIPPARTIPNLGGALNINTEVQYAFSPGEVRYARLHCPGMEFEAGTTVTYIGDPSNLIGAVNGVGSDAIYFSITAGANPVVATDILSVDGDRTLTSKAPIDCTYGLYDFPSQAQAGGSAGRVTTSSGAAIRFGASTALRVDNFNEAIADVESPEPAYSLFWPTPATTAFGGETSQIGSFSIGTVANVLGTQQPIGVDGLPVTLADLWSGDTTLVVTGDFSASALVYTSLNPNCSTLFDQFDGWNDQLAAYFGWVYNTVDEYVCYYSDGSPIPASEFDIMLFPESPDPSLYEPSFLGPLDLGRIVRNGTELQAPLAQLPGGWLSRMVLTNRGSLDRPYTVEVFGEEGTTISTDNLTGIVPAQGTVVVDLDTMLTGFSGGLPRATLNVTVAAPTNTIQGLYQIVNPDSGSISNHVMVRPGSN